MTTALSKYAILLKLSDLLTMSKGWSKICFYIFIYMLNSAQFIMAIDRGVYELHTGNDSNTLAPFIAFK